MHKSYTEHREPLYHRSKFETGDTVWLLPYKDNRMWKCNVKEIALAYPGFGYRLYCENEHIVTVHESTMSKVGDDIVINGCECSSSDLEKHYPNAMPPNPDFMNQFRKDHVCLKDPTKPPTTS